MKKDFGNMTLLDMISYLEDLDYEASVLNKNTEDLLNRERLANRLTKDNYNLLSNTLKAIKRGEIKLNGEIITPFEKLEDTSMNLIFDVDISEAKEIKSTKDLDKFFESLTDWDAGVFNSKGVTYTPLSEKGDICILKLTENKITISKTDYELGIDFNYLLNVYNKGIYLFKKVKGKLQGIGMARWLI